MEVARQCEEIFFNMTGNELYYMIEGLTLFSYLEKQLDQSDNDWTEDRSNIGKLQQVWGRLGSILKRDEADHLASAAVYSAAVQSVLLFGLETWVLSTATERQLFGVHMDF